MHIKGTTTAFCVLLALGLARAHGPHRAQNANATNSASAAPTEVEGFTFAVDDDHREGLANATSSYPSHSNGEDLEGLLRAQLQLSLKTFQYVKNIFYILHGQSNEFEPRPETGNPSHVAPYGQLSAYKSAPAYGPSSTPAVTPKLDMLNVHTSAHGPTEVLAPIQIPGRPRATVTTYAPSNVQTEPQSPVEQYPQQQSNGAVPVTLAQTGVTPPAFAPASAPAEVPPMTEPITPLLFAPIQPAAHPQPYVADDATSNLPAHSQAPKDPQTASTAYVPNFESPYRNNNKQYASARPSQTVHRPTPQTEYSESSKQSGPLPVPVPYNNYGEFQRPSNDGKQAKSKTSYSTIEVLVPRNPYESVYDDKDPYASLSSYL